MCLVWVLVYQLAGMPLVWSEIPLAASWVIALFSVWSLE
jgi:hypothetical protein